MLLWAALKHSEKMSSYNLHACLSLEIQVVGNKKVFFQRCRGTDCTSTSTWFTRMSSPLCKYLFVSCCIFLWVKQQSLKKCCLPVCVCVCRWACDRSEWNWRIGKKMNNHSYFYFQHAVEQTSHRAFGQTSKLILWINVIYSQNSSWKLQRKPGVTFRSLLCEKQQQRSLSLLESMLI